MFPRHVVFLNIAATGHMNPTLPLATELVERGVQVSYFVQETVRGVVEATGAKWYALEDTTSCCYVLKQHSFSKRPKFLCSAIQRIQRIVHCIKL